MVYDPKRPRGPSVVPGSYVITTKDGVELADMVAAVDALAKKENRTDVAWKSQFPFIGVAILSCDEDFAEKMKKLPQVGAVEKEHFVYPAQKKKPGGPRF